MFLQFYHRYATEAGFDFCMVEVSSDNGTNWQTVKSYDGTLSTWTQENVDITPFANGSTQMRIRFRLTSDAGVTGDGWYIDDIKLTGYCGTLVGISENPAIPKRFALSQNYPNPFNPSTTIKYQLPKESLVKITVFDVLGKQVGVLVNEKKNAGFYEVDFNSEGLASGLYLYKIEAGDFTDVKKMMLIK
jgi:hypothetical protein